jgi:hypothetical protein
LGTNEELLMEVIGGRTNDEMRILRDTYQRLFNKSLEKQVAGDLSGEEKQLFVGLIQGAKMDGFSLDADLEQLYKAGEGKLGTDGTIL